MASAQAADDLARGFFPTLVSVCFVHDLPPAGKASAFSQIAALKDTPAAPQEVATNAM
jgi:hypothetical protein